MVESRTATTVHGEVEYDVVECDSCGDEVVVDEALDFKIGDREGKACAYCYEEGPISFPDPSILPVFKGFGEDHQGGGFGEFLVLGWALIPMCMFGGLFDDFVDFANGVMWAAWTLTIYSAIIAVLWWVVL